MYFCADDSRPQDPQETAEGPEEPRNLAETLNGSEKFSEVAHERQDTLRNPAGRQRVPDQNQEILAAIHEGAKREQGLLGTSQETRDPRNHLDLATTTRIRKFLQERPQRQPWAQDSTRSPNGLVRLPSLVIPTTNAGTQKL